MFTVKCKHFADANITNILNIRKFFAIFFKKNSLSPPHSLNFATKARGSQQANKPTSQQVNKSTSQQVEVRQVRRVRQVRQEMGLKGPKGLPGPKTKHPLNPIYTLINNKKIGDNGF